MRERELIGGEGCSEGEEVETGARREGEGAARYGERRREDRTRKDKPTG